MIRPFVYYAFRIKDGLFIGNKRSANELLFQASNQITTIINCAALEIEVDNPLLNVINFKWQDTEDQLIVVEDNIHLVYNAIEEANRKGESVLVCCLTGQSRSVAIVTAYLMKKFRWNVKSSLQYLQICRKDFEIRKNYLFQLTLYERILYHEHKAEKSISPETDSDEILLKHTYFNSKLGEFWQKNHLDGKSRTLIKSRFKIRNKKVSWNNPVVTNIRVCKTTYYSHQLNLSKNVFDKKITEIEKEKNLTELIQQSQSYFLSKRSHKQQRIRISKSRNQSPDKLPELRISQLPERSISVISEMQSENNNKFTPSRRAPTKGEMTIKQSKGFVQFRMK